MAGPVARCCLVGITFGQGAVGGVYGEDPDEICA